MTDNTNHFYRLKVNINGFKLEDITVDLEDLTKSSGKENASAKARVKIVAKRSSESSTGTKGVESISKEYTKHHDLSASIIKQNNIDLPSMRFYLDPNNSAYLVVEFAAAVTENVFVTLDDSCESLVELAARSLLNVKSLENLREVIQDPFKNKLHGELTDMFAPNLIRDLSLATTTSFTPIRIDSDSDGNKKMQMEISLPRALQTATLKANESSSSSSGKQKNFNYVDASHDGNNENCIKLRLEGLKLHLEAVTKSADTTSTYSKEFRLPKGTDTDRMSYRIDQSRHSLVVEAPVKAI